MKQLLSLFFVFLIISVSLLSCSKEPAAEKLGYIRIGEEEVYPESVLTFNGEAISFDKFRYYYLNYRNMYLEKDPNYFSADGTEEALKEEILQCLLDEFSVSVLANENNISLSKADRKAVQSDIDTTIDFYGGREAFLASLHESYMSEQLYYEMMEYASLYLKVFDSIFAEGGSGAWTDDRFYSYYQENYVAVQEIYLAFREGENESNCPETEAAIQEIHQKALDGTDFWELVETYGEDPAMESSPDGYYFKQGEAEDTLYEASKALSPGEISNPVMGASGYYIIKRVAMTQEKMDENRETALKGYRDSLDVWHSGAYDVSFAEIYSEKSASVTVGYSEYWDKISTATVF